MTEELVRKRRIRAGHRASATRILNQVDTTLTESAIDIDKLAQMKLSLAEKLDTLKLLDGEIVELTEEDDLVNEIEQADGYKESVYQAMVKIEKATSIAPVRTIVKPMTSTPKGNRVKLPKLTLRAFDGDLTSWPTFWDSFESARVMNYLM